MKLPRTVQRTTSQTRTCLIYYQIILERDKIQSASPLLTHVIKGMDIYSMINGCVWSVFVLTGPEKSAGLFVYNGPPQTRASVTGLINITAKQFSLERGAMMTAKRKTPEPTPILE